MTILYHSDFEHNSKKYFQDCFGHQAHCFLHVRNLKICPNYSVSVSEAPGLLERQGFQRRMDVFPSLV